MIVGIDLGTTYSLVAMMRDATPVVLPNALGERLTPSAVSVLQNGEIVLGTAARARATTHPKDTALVWKRDMGTERAWRLGGRMFSPPELSALILRSLKQDAEAAVGQAIEEAVVTVPAYFDETQRRATRDAAAIAGLRADRIINEPTAAALAFGLHQRNRDLRAAVLDLGGGTYDVTILEIIDGVIEIQATAGDARLGGEDFADVLARALTDRLPGGAPALEADPAAWARIRAACEEAKRQLSAVPEARVLIPDLLVGRKTTTVDETITREQAEALWAPLIARLQEPTVRALRDAGRRREDINEVLLVGGATRMPCVARFAAHLFGRMPDRRLPPDEAVALGAAVQAALKEGNAAVADIVVTDIAPFSLGVSSGTTVGHHVVTGVFTPVIERGTVIPASRVETFHTLQDNQRQLLVEVFQGEHARCEQNRKLGDYLLRDLPPGPAGTQAIDVRFSYDINGLLEVEMTVLSSGRKETLIVQQTPGRLTADQVTQSRKALERLKFHPREALPNTTALARADAAFIEMLGPARTTLGLAIAEFRGILDGQDPPTIAEARARLTALIDALTKSR